MATLTEDYVSLETAKLLKEKGFNIPVRTVRTYYENDDHEIVFDNEIIFGSTRSWNNSPMGHISAPTQAMAMKWLRAKYIIIVVQPEYFNVDGICSYWGVDIWKDDNYVKLQGDYPSYEEACEAAIKYALENLI